MTDTAAPTAAQAPASAPARPSSGRLRGLAEALLPFAVVFGAWEFVAHLGIFPARLFPTLETVFTTFGRVIANGSLAQHTAETLLRLFGGFALAALVGVAIGILMGRVRWIEDTLLPLVSFSAPVPGLAYAPIFLMWFGLGSLSGQWP